MKPITFDTMLAAVETAVTHAQATISAEKWHIPLTGVELDTHKTKYGQATADGRILLSKAFLGTTATKKLEKTILHEISHLIVGLKHNHDNVFKRVFNALAGHIDVPQSEIEQILANNQYPLRLVAYPQDGSVPIDMGGAFKRTKKYLSYQITDKRCFLVANKRIERFAYLPFNTGIKG